MAASQAAKQVFRLPPLPTPADILRYYRVKALKQLSQNFLLDPRICHKVVKSAGRLKGAHVIEVGPGPGCLTRPILEQGATCSVIELDKRFIPSLQLIAEAVDHRLKVFRGDVLTYPIVDLIPKELAKPWDDYPPDIHLIGNLPFAISTILIVRWMKMVSERSGPWSMGRVRMTLTFQKEVSERITVPELHPERCRLSLLCQGYCQVKETMTIVGGSFVPPPEVDVGVVKFVPRVEPLFKQNFDLVEKVLRCLFNAKRKLIRASIKNLLPEHLQKEFGPKILERADVQQEIPTLILAVEDFSRICDEYAALCKQIDGLYDYDFRAPKVQREKNSQICSAL